MKKAVLHRFTELDIQDPMLAERLVSEDADTGLSELTLNNGSVIKMPTRMLLLNIILIMPYIKLGVPLREDMFNDAIQINKGMLSSVFTKQYAELVEVTDTDHKFILREFWHVIQHLSVFVIDYLCAYQRSISYLGMSRIMVHPKYAKIKSGIDTSLGNKYNEQLLTSMTNEFINIFKDKNVLPNNQLAPFLRANMLNKMQIPQQFLAYGYRSDIDDVVKSHFINESAMSGLKSVQDYATETLATKKANLFSKVVIRDTQYSAKIIRLHATPIIHRYSGDCGNRVVIPYRIPMRHIGQYMGKLVYLNGELLPVIPENYNTIADQQVSMISPTTCRHTDGICEHCCGRATKRPWAYVPDNHIGIYAGTYVGRKVSQMILSAKHLIKTMSMVYELFDKARAYFKVVGTDIYISKQFSAKYQKCQIRIPVDNLGYLTDLNSKKLPAEETFSNIQNIEIIFPSGKVDIIQMESDVCAPFFSSHFLKMLTKGGIDYSDDDHVNIPLKRFNADHPIMRYTVVNDDMLQFTKLVDTMFRSKLAEYTSIPTALFNLSSLIYSKTSVNVFFIEVLLKSFLRTSEEDARIPVVTDPDNVVFGTMDKNITDRGISIKLGHTHLGVKVKANNYFSSVQTSISPKPPALFDDIFGF